MRGRSSKHESKEGMEIDSKHRKLKDNQPHLSGAYIRSLVKQLTSSKTKDPMNPKDPDCVDVDSVSGQNLTQIGEGFSETPQTQQPQQPRQHKKQVRRRLHTSRPYQERLLNMAEARREIVTALKFHRAAMKQANEQQQQEQEQEQNQPSQPLQVSSQPCFEPGKIKSRRNPRIYPSNSANFSNYIDNLSYSSLSCPPPTNNPYNSWPASQVSPPSFHDTLNFPLPNQTLGLNLNLHDFKNLETTLYHNNNHPSIYSSLSPSSSSSPTLSFATEEFTSVAISHEAGGPPAVADVLESCGGNGLHPTMDDEAIAEIRSIGEQHQMEWNDTMNLVTSAWWFKFLKNMEVEPEEMKAEDAGYHPFDEVMEFPAWVNANESCLQQHFTDYCSDDYNQDPALPCMDIGEFDGMDSEWLA